MAIVQTLTQLCALTIAAPLESSVEDDAAVARRRLSKAEASGAKDSPSDSDAESEITTAADAQSTTDITNSSVADDTSGSSDSETDVDVVEWRAVGGKMAAMFSDLDDLDDLDAEDEYAEGWRSVGTRLSRVFRDHVDDDEEDDGVPPQWNALGARMSSLFAAHDGGPDTGEFSDADEVSDADVEAWRDAGVAVTRGLARCLSAREDDDAQDEEIDFDKWRAVCGFALRGLLLAADDED